jgi:hypothetical protein
MRYMAAPAVRKGVTLLDAAWWGCDIRLWVIFGCILNQPLRGAQTGKPLADLSIPESYRWVLPCGLGRAAFQPCQAVHADG